MSSTVIVSLAEPANAHLRAGHWGMARLAVAVVGVVGLLAMTPRAVEAQTMPGPGIAAAQSTGEQKPRWEFLIPTGTIIPTAAQRGTIERGNLTAVQLLYVLRPGLAITSTLGWARSRDIASVGAPKLDVFTYDLGAEVRARRWRAGKRVSFSPFAGGGAGARSYNHRDRQADATHDVGAYVSAGGEIGVRRVRVRLEVRDYVTGFAPLGGAGTTRARNDVVVMTGLRFTRR